MAENQDDSTSQGQPMSSFVSLKAAEQPAKSEVVVPANLTPEVAPAAPETDGVTAKPLPQPLQKGVVVRSV